MSAGAFPVEADDDPLVRSMREALAAIEVIGPDKTGEVSLRLTAAWGSVVDHALGKLGVSAAADAWLAWRDLLA